jgi:hypothetical protein
MLFAAVHESVIGTKPPIANATVCPQLAKADIISAASVAQLVNKGEYLFPDYEKYATTSNATR